MNGPIVISFIKDFIYTLSSSFFTARLIIPAIASRAGILAAIAIIFGNQPIYLILFVYLKNFNVTISCANMKIMVNKKKVIPFTMPNHSSKVTFSQPFSSDVALCGISKSDYRVDF